MIRLIFIIIVLQNYFLFSQNNQIKEYFFDINEVSLDRETFKKRLKEHKGKGHFKTFKTDSTRVYKLVNFDEYGSFSNEVKAKIVKELEKISGKKINQDETIIINFYIKDEGESNRPCIDFYTSDEGYIRFTKNKKNKIKQFFVVEKNYLYNKNPVCFDNDQLIENLVFSNALGCGNYIIIKPNGNFFRKLCEYRQDKIKEIFKSKW